MDSGFQPPVQYLRECSDNSLRHFEVVKLEHVANLRSELRALWEEMIEESALALLSRWMIENRASLRSRIRTIESPLAVLETPPFPCAPAPAGDSMEAPSRPLLEPPIPRPTRVAGPAVFREVSTPAAEGISVPALNSPGKILRRGARFRRRQFRPPLPGAS